MSIQKKVAAISIAFIFVISFISCSSATIMPTSSFTITPAATFIPLPTASPILTPSPMLTTAIPSPTETLETASPEPEDMFADLSYIADYKVSDLKRIGLSEAEYKKIYTLIYSALAMKNEMYPPFFFKDASKLTPPELFNFLIEELSYFADNGDYATADNCDYSIHQSDIEYILKSAFDIDYHSDYAGDPDDNPSLTYSNGMYTYSEPQGSEIVPYIYNIARIKPDELKIKLDVVMDGDEGSGYDGKAQAILKEDPNSLFGFYLVSLTKSRETKPQFPTVIASSFRPPKGKKTYDPANILDNKESTIWMPGKGKNQWIEIESLSPQTVTGVIVNFNYDDFSDWQPDVEIELSDGSKFSPVFNDSNYISFGKEIKTTYIKIILNGEDSEENVADIWPY